MADGYTRIASVVVDVVTDIDPHAPKPWSANATASCWRSNGRCATSNPWGQHDPLRSEWTHRAGNRRRIRIGFATAQMLAQNNATVALNYLPDDSPRAGRRKALTADG